MLKSKIGSIMKIHGKSTVILARETGLSVRTVIRLIKSRNIEEISFDTLLKIALVLKCRLQDLFEAS